MSFIILLKDCTKFCSCVYNANAIALMILFSVTIIVVKH